MIALMVIINSEDLCYQIYFTKIHIFNSKFQLNLCYLSLNQLQNSKIIISFVVIMVIVMAKLKIKNPFLFESRQLKHWQQLQLEAKNLLHFMHFGFHFNYCYHYNLLNLIEMLFFAQSHCIYYQTHLLSPLTISPNLHYFHYYY